MLRFLIVVATFVSLLWTTTSVPAELFSGDAPTREWSRFSAKDFPDPVSGMVFRENDLVCAGMPLGGLGTGCIEFESRKTYGRHMSNHVFEMHVQLIFTVSINQVVSS